MSMKRDTDILEEWKPCIRVQRVSPVTALFRTSIKILINRKYKDFSISNKKIKCQSFSVVYVLPNYDFVTLKWGRVHLNIYIKNKGMTFIHNIFIFTKIIENVVSLKRIVCDLH